MNNGNSYTTSLDPPVHGQPIEYFIIVTMESGTSYTTSIIIVQLQNLFFIPVAILLLVIGLSPLFITAALRYKSGKKIEI